MAISMFVYNILKINENILLLITVLTFVFIIVSGCATSYYPKASDRVMVENDYAIIKADDISFAISHKRWASEPQKISDYFTTYHVIIKNESSESITISYEDIILLDEDRNQYDTIRYSDVGDMMFKDDYLIDKFMPYHERENTRSDNLRRARASLMQNSLHFGDIMPNARKSGYIFFSRISPANEKTSILFRGVEIVFVKK